MFVCVQNGKRTDFVTVKTANTLFLLYDKCKQSVISMKNAINHVFNVKRAKICLFNIKDPNNKVIHNYHLVSLKMLGNIYQTTSGLEFIMDDTSSQ